jgi:hypothetical protein
MDYLKQGQGIDGGKDENWALKQVDRKAMRRLYGPDVGGPATGDESRGGVARKSGGTQRVSDAKWPSDQ